MAASSGSSDAQASASSARSNGPTTRNPPPPLVAARDPQAATRPPRAPIDHRAPAELTLDARTDHPRAVALRRRRLHCRAAGLAPIERQTARLEFPGEVDAASVRGQCAVLGRVH